ncbi:MAG: glycosyltransferase, partial [bacterium]
MKKGSPQNQKYRIAHLQLLPLLSGVQRVTLEEVTRLDPTRFEPTVICKEEGPLTEALKTRGIPYFCVPELVREISPLQDLKALIRLKRLFSEGQFDIVHTHSSKTGILGRLAGKWAGVPIVMHTVHGFAFPAAKNLFEKSLYYGLEWLGARLTDALVVLNRHDFSLALKKLRVAKDMIFLMPNGVDTSVFLKPEENVRNKVRSEVFQVRRN